MVLKYRPPRKGKISRLSNKSLIQTIFNTDAGKVLNDDEWMTPELLADLKAALPKGVDIDEEEFADWHSKPDLTVMFHGYDLRQKNEEEDIEGLAFVVFYIDLLTNYGIIYMVETEGIE